MSAPSFSFADRISKHLSLDLDKAKTTIFDELVKDIEMFTSQPVTGMLQLRNKHENSMKGDLWERFCLIYLGQTKKCTQVWTLTDLPVEVSKTLKLPRSQDNGIDLVGYIDGKGYVAIQCKYRSPYSKSVAYKNGQRIFTSAKVTWSSISTFVGLCAQTGPWYQQWIVTNCSGIGNRKIPRTAKDKSLCLKTFQGTAREEWIAIMKSFSGSHGYTELGVKSGETTKEPTLEELRSLRLKCFEHLLSPASSASLGNSIESSSEAPDKENKPSDKESQSIATNNNSF